LVCESLEDRTTPTVSTISASFNGIAIPAGDYVWFSSEATVTGVGSKPVTVDVTDQTISFTAKGTKYTLDVPNSTITFNPATKQASTSFADGGWSVSSPTKFDGSEFLSGLGWQAAKGLPGGIKNVTWSGDFTSDTKGVKLDWDWSAAVYSEFTSNMSGVEVKTLTDKRQDVINNSNPDGTPENFKASVVGGALGKGGTNWTGNESSNAVVKLSVQTGGTAVISGNAEYTVLGDDAGPAVGEP
jgi:hypothetical protein